MELENSYDKVVLSHEEVQTALKDYIAKHIPSRVVRGDVVMGHAQRSVSPLTVKVEKCKPSVISSAHCYLEPFSTPTAGATVGTAFGFSREGILRPATPPYPSSDLIFTKGFSVNGVDICKKGDN